jgi:thiol-disulfide isomerase/thioredoxin
MSIVYLKPENFYVTEKNELANNLPQFSLVFFTSATCHYCRGVLPAFAAAATKVAGCVFAIMDVDQNEMRVVKQSEKTTLPIAYVPLIIMYVNGIPIAVFDPDEDHPEANVALLKRFVVTTANAARAGLKLRDLNDRNGQQKVCETSIGMALCGKGPICYLKTCDAYKSK